MFMLLYVLYVDDWKHETSTFGFRMQWETTQESQGNLSKSLKIWASQGLRQSDA